MIEFLKENCFACGEVELPQSNCCKVTDGGRQSFISVDRPWHTSAAVKMYSAAAEVYVRR